MSVARHRRPPKFRLPRIAMYTRFVAVTFALLTSMVSAAEAQQNSGLEALSFMQGCWRGPLGDGQGDFIEERYAPPTGNLMLGSVVYVRDGRATQHEFVELRSEDGAVSFLPYPGGRRSEHTFLMTAGNGTSAVFEAPEHDYPKRILYRAVGRDGLEGSIDGGPEDATPRRWPLRRIACEGEAGIDMGSSRDSTEANPAALGEFRRHLEWLTRDGTAWTTANPGGQGGIDSFGMRYDVIRGGSGATGCLWGESDGEVVGVFWDFFQAWDPVSGKVLVYQSGPGGDIGMGEETTREGPRAESVQTFVWSDGSTLVQKHLLEERGDDTFVTESLNLVEGDWSPANTFTWTRTDSRPSVCSGEGRQD